MLKRLTSRGIEYIISVKVMTFTACVRAEAICKRRFKHLARLFIVGHLERCVKDYGKAICKSVKFAKWQCAIRVGIAAFMLVKGHMVCGLAIVMHCLYALRTKLNVYGKF